jgi:SAM-dependent methyltransferase
MSAATTSATIALRPNLASVLDANLAAYEALAEDYRETSPLRMKHAAEWLSGPLSSDSPKPLTRGRALDIGCADGSHAFLLAEHGYDVTGIDFSPRMIELARGRRSGRHQPSFLEGEFLAGSFCDAHGATVELDGQFELVVANAFVHLFPEPVDKDVVRKALDLVAAGGAALFSTTIEDSRQEAYFGKAGAGGTYVQRWRGHYPKEDFLSLIRDAAGDSFVITNLPTTDMRAKEWLTVLARRQAAPDGLG